MNRAWLGSLKPFSRLLFYILLSLACFGILFMAAMLLAGPLFGASLQALPDLLTQYANPDAVRLMKYFQVIQSIGLFILPPLLAGFLFTGNSARYLSLDRIPPMKMTGLSVLLFLVMVPLVNGMIAWNESLKLPEIMAGLEQWMRQTEETAAMLTEAFMKTETAGGFLFNVLMIAILPAIGEELVFRGALQRILAGWTRNVHVAVFLSALAFSAMHLQFYGLLPRFFLGMVFGYLFVRTGSLWIPILLHFLNNLAALIFGTLAYQGVLSEDAGDLGSGSPLLIVLSLLLTTALAVYFFRNGIPPQDSSARGEADQL